MAKVRYIVGPNVGETPVETNLGMFQSLLDFLAPNFGTVSEMADNLVTPHDFTDKTVLRITVEAVDPSEVQAGEGN